MAGLTFQHSAKKIHPVDFLKKCWPDVYFYDKQREIIDAVRYADEVDVPAGNMLGKDFVTGAIVVSFFLNPAMYHLDLVPGTTCRIITTSVRDDHLRVLWSEIRRFIAQCKYVLQSDKGGPLIINYRDIRILRNNNECTHSYLKGMVAEKPEGFAGHHASYTLGVGDEASGLNNIILEQMQGWARKLLFIGNPNPCMTFFKKHVEGGDIVAKEYPVGWGASRSPLGSI